MKATSNVSCLARLIAAVSAAIIVTAVVAVPVSATVCVVPDNGGTAKLPPASPSAGCTDGYLSPSDVHVIIDGLPPPQTIEIGVEHSGFLCPGTLTICSFPTAACQGGPNNGNPCSGATACPGGMCVPDCDQPGGTLLGEEECSASTLQMQLNGTNGLVYTRGMNMPIEFETHIAPRTPGNSVQSFDTDMFRLFGQITNPGAGDPDFDLLRITAGTDFGMPSPGHTTLVQVPGGWNVDSFFDITYRIDFVGAPGGPFAGMSGSTTGTIRMQIGEPAVFDHLECYKPKDPLKFQATVDLPALAGGLYSAAGCVVKGKAKKYCTPVMKTVLTSDVPITPMPGPNLTSDYLCYKMKCPKILTTQGIVDQFGARTLEKIKTQKELCVPAQKTP